MKRTTDGTFLYSPTDLVAFLEGDFAAWMERAWAESPKQTGGGAAGAGSRGGGFAWSPDEDDADSALVKRKGEEHETRVLARLQAAHGEAAVIARDGDAEGRTYQALRSGVPLIYQGLFMSPPWHGYPDFLVRSSEPSALGEWSYRPSDSKLARSPKPYFLVQLCAYADLLERAQGLRPRTLHLVLGDDSEPEFETERFIYFYRHLKETFERFQRDFDPLAMPDPSLEAGFGRWEAAGERVLEERDDLRIVARITRSQIKRLRDDGIRTAAQLAGSSGPCARMAADVLARLRRQARLQIESRGLDLPRWEVLPPPDGRTGLRLLPPASPGDVFFDLEGFPLADGMLEYLFGAVTLESGKPVFTAWWAHSEAEEKRAFEAAIDWLYAQWQNDPAMHIYHYAQYEVTALQRLMGKYGTREKEVDALLRGEVLVDLCAVVRQGVAIGTKGYSLKDIEVLFAPPREAGVIDAGGSIAEYQRWLDSGQPPDPARSPILADIAHYNREDCENTWHLAEWLWKRQAESGIAYVPHRADEAGEEPEEEWTSDAELLAARLMDSAEEEPDPEERRLTELVAWLLGYHRREEKPMWWRYYDHLASTEEELGNAPDCLAGVERTDSAPVPVRRSRLAEYRFDPDQDTKLGAGDKVYVVADGLAVSNEIQDFNPELGLLTILFGPSKPLPERCHLIPNEYVPAHVVRRAVYRFAERRAADGTAEGAAWDLLGRRPPRLASGRRGDVIPAEPDLPADLLSLVRDLDGTTLCIQGPPGSGKTRNAGAVIAALAAEGMRVGVASNGHKAVLNLLDSAVRAAGSAPGFTVLKVGGDETAEDLAARGMGTCKSNEVAAQLAGRAGGVVVGGTAWVFSREELADRFDYLFIDEAGQVPLANAVAMSLAARNLVLIGDQMQLAQPIQGTHPGESGLSCLHYFLKGHATVPADKGVFLPRTWRLHPGICDFISATAYEGRLQPVDVTAERAVVPPGGAVRLVRGTGIVIEEVAHDGNTQSSEEEADGIAELLAELERSHVVDEGRRRFDRVGDLLIVAPYNAQVRLLRQRLGSDLRIASVDKFQGQEANVVIVSMCASNAEDTPRGSGFLLDPNRLNVAVSRARCLAIVVASSNLVRARPNSVREMELLNLFCRLREYGTAVGQWDRGTVGQTGAASVR